MVLTDVSSISRFSFIMSEVLPDFQYLKQKDFFSGFVSLEATAHACFLFLERLGEHAWAIISTPFPCETHWPGETPTLGQCVFLVYTVGAYFRCYEEKKITVILSTTKDSKI